MNRSLSKKFLGIGLLTLLSIIPTETEAVYAGIKSMGRAGAVAAHAIDSSVIAYNPAGMSWVPEQLNIGFIWIVQDGKTIISDNDTMDGKYTTHKNKNFYLPDLSGCMHYMQRNWTIGFAAYTRNFLKSNYNVGLEELGESKLGLEYLHETISPAFAIKLGEYHSFGLSLDLMAQRLKVDGLQRFAHHRWSIHPHRVTNQEYDYSMGIGCTLGWVGNIWPCVRMGFAWSPEVKMQHFDKYKGLLARKGKFFIPQRFTGGISVNVCDNIIIEVDGEHNAWDELACVNHTDEALDHFRPFGRDHGVGLGWWDIMTWRTGIEYVLNPCFSMRLGYQHTRSPIPTSQTFLNLLTPDVIEDWVTGGSTLWHDWCGEFTFFVAYGFNHKNKGRWNNIPEEFGGGRVELHEKYQVTSGLSWTKYY